MRYLFVLLLLAGCATKQGGWDKPGATEQDFHMDRGQCIAQSYATYTPFQRAAIMAGCMQGKGWYWVEQ